MTRIVMGGVGCICGHFFEGRWYESVNTQLGPDDVEPFLNREINRFECPECHKATWFPTPVLFNDMEREFMVWVGGRHQNTEDGFVQRLEGRNVPHSSSIIYAEDFSAALDALRAFRDDPANVPLPFKEMTVEKSDEFIETFLRLYEEFKAARKRPVQ
jgi:hypothetical protein